jgi:hypothetical protein
LEPVPAKYANEDKRGEMLDPNPENNPEDEIKDDKVDKRRYKRP